MAKRVKIPQDLLRQLLEVGGCKVLHRHVWVLHPNGSRSWGCAPDCPACRTLTMARSYLNPGEAEPCC